MKIFIVRRNIFCVVWDNTDVHLIVARETNGPACIATRCGKAQPLVYVCVLCAFICYHTTS